MSGSARSYAASGLAAGRARVTTYNAGPFVAGAALHAFARIGACHVPVGTGSSERLLLVIEQLLPDAVVLTPSYAATCSSSAICAASSVRRILVAGEPGGGEPAFRAKLEDGWGARVTEAMGIGDIGPSLWGECEQQEGMHLGARGFVHAELIDPDTGEARELAGRGDGGSCSPTCSTRRRRCSASARATTSRCGRAPVAVDVRRRAFAASGARTTC